MEKIIWQIKIMCFDIYLTVDNKAFNLSFKPLKMQLRGGSYQYFCNGKYRTIKWIEENGVDIHNEIIL